MVVIRSIKICEIMLAWLVILLYGCNKTSDFEYKNIRNSIILINSGMSEAIVDGKKHNIKNCENKILFCIVFYDIAIAAPKQCNETKFNNNVWNVNGLRFYNRIPSLHGGTNDGIYVSDQFPNSGFEFRDGKIRSIYITRDKSLNDYIGEKYSWRDLEPYKFSTMRTPMLFQCSR